MDTLIALVITADATRWLGKAQNQHRFKTNNSSAKQTLNLTLNPAIV